jgi:hypothetical protein
LILCGTNSALLAFAIVIFLCTTLLWCWLLHPYSHNSKV